MVRSLLLVCGLFSLALGWGQEGHKIVSQLATNRLSTKAAQKVNSLLSGKSLMDICVYADDYRSANSGKWTAPLHYCNVPRGAPTFTMSYCPGLCVVKAVQNYTRITDAGGDSTTKCDWNNREKEPCSLEFLVHFVEDLHQPLHLGYADDSGGNDVQVRFFDKTGNLHSLWDTLILERWDKDFLSATQKLENLYKSDAAFRAQVDAIKSITDPVQWAVESYNYVKSTVYDFKTEGKVAIIDEAYYQKGLPIVQIRLFLAGIRLANSINAAFVNVQEKEGYLFDHLFGNDAAGFYGPGVFFLLSISALLMML